jgi:hypothetical protein
MRGLQYLLKKQCTIESIDKYKLKFVSAFRKESRQIVSGFLTKMGSFCDKNRP